MKSAVISNKISENIVLAVERLGGEDPHAAAVWRENSAGVKVGKRLSFIQDCPAGDLTKQLKASGLKGRALKREVRNVLAGKRTLAVAQAVAYLIGAAEQGFCPVRVDSNKAGDVRTIRLEEGNMTSAEQKAKAIRESSPKELLEAAKAQLQAQPELSAEDQALLKALGGEVPGATVSVESKTVPTTEEPAKK